VWCLQVVHRKIKNTLPAQFAPADLNPIRLSVLAQLQVRFDTALNEDGTPHEPIELVNSFFF